MKNTTDQCKQVILKMFQQPIEEVEEAFEKVFRKVEDKSWDSLVGSLMPSLKLLRRKLNTLKAALPTIQEGE